jgi:hypothetical protein
VYDSESNEFVGEVEIPVELQTMSQELDNLMANIIKNKIESWFDIVRNMAKDEGILDINSDSQPMFRETCRVVRQWFPKSEMLIVQNANHWLQLTNPTDLAVGLVNFFRKHSIKNFLYSWFQFLILSSQTQNARW